MEQFVCHAGKGAKGRIEEYLERELPGANINVRTMGNSQYEVIVRYGASRRKLREVMSRLQTEDSTER